MLSGQSTPSAKALANPVPLGHRSVATSRVAPAGRVIRNAGQPIIPCALPANADLLQRPTKLQRRMKRIAAVVVGVTCGGIISLCLPRLDLLSKVDSPDQIWLAVASNLSESNDRVQQTSLASSRRQVRVQQAVQRVSSRTISAEHKKPVEAPTKLEPARPEVVSFRLASYSVESKAREEIKPQAKVILPKAVLPVETTQLHPARALVGRVHSIIKKYAPKHKTASNLAHAIVRESVLQGVDPLFVAAVIKSESTFNATARSRIGAQGLMQIMPATGAWITEKQDLPRGKLTDPGHNLRLGISYLKHLEESYSGNRVFALVAYNWGPGHVDSAAVGKRRIPKECMQYALKIINDYKRWSSGVI